MTVSFQDAFNLSRGIGSAIPRASKERQQRDTLSQILQEAQASGDPAVLQSSIGKILSQVDPERQGEAVKYIQSIAQENQAKQQAQGLREAGIDPRLPPKIQEKDFEIKKQQDVAESIIQGRSIEELNNNDLARLSTLPRYKEFAKAGQELKKEKPSSKAQEKFKEKIFTSIFDTLNESSNVQRGFQSLKRARELSNNLSGVAGAGKALFGSQDAAEFNGIGIALLEAPIHALFGKNQVSRNKFQALKDALVPAAGERWVTQQGKLNALEMFNKQAMEKVQRIKDLYDQYGLDIPFEEVFKFNQEAEDLFNQTLDMSRGVKRDEKKKEEIIPEADKGFTPPKGKELLPTPPNVEGFFKGFGKELSDFTGVEDAKSDSIADIPFDAVKDTISDFAKVGRGVTKAAGSAADFVNFLGSLISNDTRVDVKKHTKEAFGEEMDFEELATKAFDYITLELGKPKSKLDEYAESAFKVGAEFATPAGVLGKSRQVLGKAASEGMLAGTALQAAKDADLGILGELGALFTPMFANKSPQAFEKAYEVVRDPKVLLQMGEDFAQWVKSAPSKAAEAIKAAPTKIKEKIRKPSAKAIAKHLDLKEGQIIKEGAEKISKKVRQPLSEVFSNQQVNAIESKMSQHPEGAQYYEPLFAESSKKSFAEYEEVLADASKSKAKGFVERFDTAEARAELKQSFQDAVMEETESVKAQFNADFGKMKRSRPKDARITPAQTKTIIADARASIEEIKKGGTVTGDNKTIEYLESFIERMEKPSPVTKEASKEIAKLESEIAAVEKRIADKPVFRQSGMGQKEIAELKKKLEPLKKKAKPLGAEVEEVEAGYRKVNRALNWDTKMDINDLKKIKLKGSIKTALNSYGQKNPKYLERFNALNKRYADKKDTILSEMAFKFLKGEDPELVKMWLDKPANVNKFNRMIADQGDIFFKELGDDLKAAKAYEIITPKIFDKNLSVKPTIGKFSQREEDLLLSLLGKRAYRNIKDLSSKFSRDSAKMEVYRNRSLSGVHVSMDAKKVLKASGFWDLIKAGVSTFQGKLGKGAKQIATGAGKIAGSNQDKILSSLLTDTKFQEALLEVVKDSGRAKPNYKGLEQVSKALKERGLAVADVLKEQSK